MLLSNKVYNVIKWITQYLLPVIGLWLVGANIKGIVGAQTIGVIFIVALFLSTILRISSSTYVKSGADTDGTLQIDVRDSRKDIYRLQLNSDLEDLADKKRIILIVDPKAKLSD